MRLVLVIFAIVWLTGCRSDETVAGYGGADNAWHLVMLDNTSFPARATLVFEENGKISGEAPCNRYFATQTAPYPWFSAQQIGATRRACPELDQENAYLAALSEMTLAEVAGDTLILSNDAGRELLFKAAE